RSVLEIAGVSRAALNKIAGGYSVDRACVDWDSARFEVLAAEGRRLLDQGDTRGALQPLRAALACWRGQVASELDHATGELARRIALNDPTLTYAPNQRPSTDHRRTAPGPLSVRPLIEWLAEAAAVSPSAIERDVRAHMDHLAEPGPDALEERRYRRRRVPH